jgi:hypothetical protein
MAWDRKSKVTRRERFAGEMDAVIRWSRLVKLIEPHFAKAGQGRQPLGLDEDAAELLLVAVVQSVGPTGRSCDLRQ